MTSDERLGSLDARARIDASNFLFEYCSTVMVVAHP